MIRRAACLLALPAISALAAEQGAETTPSRLPLGLQNILLWVNFALLVWCLSWLTKKYGGPYLAGRKERIEREIVEAAKIRKEAESRSAEVDQRLANLETDLAALRAESRQELESLERHHAAKTSAEMARIQTAAEQEVAAAGKAARLDLKRYSAQLAVNLAGEKIRARMTPGSQQRLVRDFVHELEGDSRAQAN